MKTNFGKIAFLIAVFAVLLSCTDDKPLSDFTPPPNPELSHENDVFLYNNEGKSLYERLGISVLWKWDDDFIGPAQRATPIKESLVINAAKLIDYLWIGSYESQGEMGKTFIKEYSPPEIVLIGSYIYTDDGSRILGFAEAGVRISLLNMNGLDFQDADWMLSTSGGVMATMNHEFSHIIHQKNGLPGGFNTISDSYLGSSWSNNVSLSDAIKLGMVRNYGTLNEYEDFCEIVSHYVGLDENTFNSIFINQDDCTQYTNATDIIDCYELNEGRSKIALKLDLTKKFFLDEFDINLTDVRDSLLTRVEKVIEINDIPVL
jgi:substrate import-associated zinc metallohydrolase lipoprotein